MSTNLSFSNVTVLLLISHISAQTAQLTPYVPLGVKVFLSNLVFKPEQIPATHISFLNCKVMHPYSIPPPWFWYCQITENLSGTITERNFHSWSLSCCMCMDFTATRLPSWSYSTISFLQTLVSSNDVVSLVHESHLFCQRKDQALCFLEQHCIWIWRWPLTFLEGETLVTYTVSLSKDNDLPVFETVQSLCRRRSCELT